MWVFLWEVPSTKNLIKARGGRSFFVSSCFGISDENEAVFDIASKIFHVKNVWLGLDWTELLLMRLFVYFGEKTDEYHTWFGDLVVFYLCFHWVSILVHVTKFAILPILLSRELMSYYWVWKVMLITSTILRKEKKIKHAITLSCDCRKYLASWKLFSPF